jgi:hypothetical protein
MVMGLIAGSKHLACKGKSVAAHRIVHAKVQLTFSSFARQDLELNYLIALADKSWCYAVNKGMLCVSGGVIT